MFLYRLMQRNLSVDIDDSVIFTKAFESSCVAILYGASQAVSVAALTHSDFINAVNYSIVALPIEIISSIICA